MPTVIVRMLDIKLLREDTDRIKKQLARKGVDPIAVDTVLQLDHKRRKAIQKRDELKAQQNEASQDIAKATPEKKAELLAAMRLVSEQSKTANNELQNVEAEYEAALLALPAPPADEAPDGGEENNQVMRTVGEKPEFSFTPREHWEIGEMLGILDMERGAKVSGSRFYYLRDDLAILQMALMNWAFLEITKRGFSPTIPPFMTRADALRGTGFLDKDENYVVNPGEDDLYLIGTSEVPLMGYHSDEILSEADMPMKFAGYSPCFRREAGSYGKDMKGILRVHQFEKIEMVALCTPEQAQAIHEQMREVEEDLLQALGIPYQVVLIAAGDLGNSAAKKYDLEAWLPGQGQYREMTSTSNCTDFQTRRLGIRIRREDGTIVPAYSLNGTAVSSRPLIAIMENFQNEDGTVDIPEVLWPYTGGMKQLTGKKRA